MVGRWNLQDGLFSGVNSPLVTGSASCLTRSQLFPLHPWLWQGETLQIQSIVGFPALRSPEKARGAQAVGLFSSGFGFLSFLFLNIFFSNEGSWFGCVTFWVSQLAVLSNRAGCMEKNGWKSVGSSGVKGDPLKTRVNHLKHWLKHHCTFPETNIAPEKFPKPEEKGWPSNHHCFQWRHVGFWWVYYHIILRQFSPVFHPGVFWHVFPDF